MIPEIKQPAVKKALQTAFGVCQFEDIQQLTKGLSSAMIFKIIVCGNPYLLRVITREDAMADPALYFGNMKLAAEAAVAPPIYYLSIEDRISITGFVQQQFFSIPEAREMMPHLLQQLHALPTFPFRINYFETMEKNFVTKFPTSNILPESATKDLLELYGRIASVYPRNDKENLVSCHNDLKPENILFDGLRPWLIDWEAAFLNDRYLDLAVVANFVVNNDIDEAGYLERYFGEVVDEYKRARFFVMSQLLHIYYCTVFFLLGAKGKPIDIDNIGKQDFRAFHNQMWNGEINLANNEAKLQYAWVHREEFFRKMQTNRFENSLRIVSGYNKFHLAEPTQL